MSADVPVVVLPGPIWDADAVAHGHESLLAELPTHGNLVLDASQLAYVDCFGFEAILTTIRRSPGRTCIAGASRSLEEMFVLANLRSAFEFYPTVDRARDAASRTSDPS